MPQVELERERAAVARLYARLDALRHDTERRLDEVRRTRPGGGHQARSERDAFAKLHEDRLGQLREVDSRLVFGRLLLEGDTADALHIGRIGLRDAEERTVLVDWRAPQAAAFYQATAASPMGVRARRHISMSGRDVTGVDDEVFDERLLEGRDAAGLRGDGALMAAIGAHRTGRMHDIVATIQAEQDRIIRSNHRGALVVQGAPGTGKTAVALHRAAYLLYTRRERLRSAGVLVVGPTPAFMAYIDQVLPALGETGVVMRALGELYPGIEARGEDAPEVAALKGEVGMAGLIARAIRSRQRAPREAVTVRVDDEELVVEPALIQRAIAAAQRTGKPHNTARVGFVRTALAELTDRLAERLREAGATLDDDDIAALREDIRTAHDVKVLLNTAWLPLSPEKLLRDLYARPQWLAELTPRWREERRALLHRDRTEPFTIGDVPLLDEAAELLGPFPESHRSAAAARERERQRERDLENARQAIRNAGVEGMVTAERLVENFAESGDRLTTAERASADRSWTYGHVVVDEAQELSPMQWRLLVRRCPLRSFTIVGDMAQSTTGATSWAAVLDPHFRDSWRLEQLTVNYRTPALIADEAESYARSRGLAVTPARAVRAGEWPVGRERVRSGGVITAAVEAVRRPGEDAGGTTAVIAPAGAVGPITAALRRELGEDVVGAGRDITVLDAHDAKGLEFDRVVLVDPDAIEREAPRGASSVYVAMTRATARLSIVVVTE